MKQHTQQLTDRHQDSSKADATKLHSLENHRSLHDTPPRTAQVQNVQEERSNIEADGKINSPPPPLSKRSASSAISPTPQSTKKVNAGNEDENMSDDSTATISSVPDDESMCESEDEFSGLSRVSKLQM